MRNGGATLVCDTPSVAGTLFGHPVFTAADAPLSVAVGTGVARTDLTPAARAR